MPAKGKPDAAKSMQRVVTFKVEEEVAAFLDAMPNKSDFIRKALLNALLEPCPVCNGKGSVPRSLARDLEMIFKKKEFVPCSFCGYEFPLDSEKSRKGDADRERLRQYLGGGDFYCDECYGKTQECTDCGEHVVQTRMSSHKKQHRLTSVRIRPHQEQQ
ncbi:MAG TPA: hypothetical protein VEK08_12515 [Planctomycetota bacterium]|nr:hypothetical protein [Planctomycetota bacterium]